MSSRTEITQRAEFECSYILPVFGKKNDLHSHRYRIEVTVDGPQRLKDNGMVIEFSRLRQLLNKILPDKSFIYQSHDGRGDSYFCVDPDIRCVVEALEHAGVNIFHVPCLPTVENLCDYFAKSLQYILNEEEPGVRVLDVKLRENNDSFASWSVK